MRSIRTLPFGRILLALTLASVAFDCQSAPSGPPELAPETDGNASATDATIDTEGSDTTVDDPVALPDPMDAEPDNVAATDTQSADGSSDSDVEGSGDAADEDLDVEGDLLPEDALTAPLWVSDDSFGPPPAFDAGTQVSTDLFHGVRLVSRTTDEPRPLNYHVVQIDPTVEGMEWMVTPANGEAVARETTRQTTWDFVSAYDLSVGINAHFFTPWPAEDPWADVLGAAMSDGDAYSDCSAQWDEVLMVNGAGRVSIQTCEEYDALRTSSTEDERPRYAIGTNDRIVSDGEVTANWQELHPRTAVGVNGSGQLLLVVADGRQDGVSEGLTTPELAGILIEFGAEQALNLDGGGSSTLVVSDPQPRVVNRPVGYLLVGTERENGSNFGLRAPEIPRAAPD